MNDVVTHEVAAAFLQQTHSLTIMDAVSATGTKVVNLSPPRPAKPKDMAIRPVTRDYNLPAVGICDMALLYALVNGAVPGDWYEAQKALVARPHVYAPHLPHLFGVSEETFFEKFGLDLLSISEPLEKFGFPAELVDPPPPTSTSKNRRIFITEDHEATQPVRVPARTDLWVKVVVPGAQEFARTRTGAERFLVKAQHGPDQRCAAKIGGPFSWLGAFLAQSRMQAGAPLTASPEMAEAIFAGINAALDIEAALSWLFHVIHACPTIGAFDFVTDGYWHADHGLPSPGIWPTGKPVAEHLSGLIEQGVKAEYPRKLREYARAKTGVYSGWELLR